MGRRHHHGHHPEQCTGDHHENGKDAVLGTQESKGAFVNVLGDFGHTWFSSALGFDPTGLNEHVNEANDGQGGHEIEDRV